MNTIKHKTTKHITIEFTGTVPKHIMYKDFVTFFNNYFSTYCDVKDVRLKEYYIQDFAGCKEYLDENDIALDEVPF